MNLPSIIILAIILICFILALRHILRRKGGCGCGCSGYSSDCTHCSNPCSHHK